MILKKVLTNVKTLPWWPWGEVQLGALLEQMLAPKYMSQVTIKKNSQERVDFAVVIPSAKRPNNIVAH